MRHLAGFRFRVLSAALLVALAAACGGSDNDSSSQAEGNERKSITFMAGFKPQANLPFVGVYVAQEKGFFEEAFLQADA